MPVLLDTNIAIRLRDNDIHALRRIAASPERVMISLVTLVELEGGTATRSQDNSNRREALETLLLDIGVAPLDRAVVACYGKIARQMGFSRRLILDRLIAATAIVNDWTLATNNAGDFCNIPRLKLEVWPDPDQ